MPTVTPYWKLRRLAPRAIRILGRLAPNSKYLVLFQKTLVPKAQKFMTAYDLNTNAEASRKKEMKEGRTAITALLKEMQEVSPLLKRDVPGFDGSIFGDQPQVPDDVIEDGERMMTLVESFRDNQGNPLDYQQLVLERLGAALQAATKEWAEAETANTQRQQGFAEVRKLGDELQTELVALRRCLTVVVGRHDLNYQKLRVDRAGYPDEDDDPSAPPPPTPVAPAAPGATVRPNQ